MGTVGAISPRWRGDPRSPVQQLDFHLLPVVVFPGEESVLVATGQGVWSANRHIFRVSSFLGVAPGDEVEMAVDVVSNDGLVLYTRSVHKETRGIYDAWHHEAVPIMCVLGVTVTITCRVNGKDRESRLQALFEGLVRLWIE